MKKFTVVMLSLLAAATLLLTMTLVASAADPMMGTGSAPVVNTSKLKAAVDMINADAKMPNGDAAITKVFMNKYNVTRDKVSSLVGKGLQYGDVAAVLAFAETMPGKINDANIDRIVGMRSKGSWDQLASNFSTNMPNIAGKVNSVEDSIHDNIKLAMAETYAAQGVGAGGMGSMGTGTGMGGGMNQPSVGNEPGAATGGTGTYEGEEGGTVPEGSTGGTGTYGGTGGTSDNGNGIGGTGY